MSDTPERQPDQDPAPIQNSDAERLSGEDSPGTANAKAEEIERDPSSNPQDEELRDLKGG